MLMPATVQLVANFVFLWRTDTTVLSVLSSPKTPNWSGPTGGRDQIPDRRSSGSDRIVPGERNDLSPRCLGTDIRSRSLAVTIDPYSFEVKKAGARPCPSRAFTSEVEAIRVHLERKADPRVCWKH